MINDLITNPEVRHDFVLFFDVKDGNPNGDPDAGNMPRVDPETMHGLVTDVCLKRKIRNWIDIAKGNDERYKIYVEDHGVLNEQHQRAYTALELEPKSTKQDRDTISKARAWMCENFFDIRLFGAVMTTRINCGQVRGPVQLTFARSINPITPLDLSITRVAVTKSEDAHREDGGKTTEMGRKTLVPYGLYKGYGFYTPHFGKDTGVNSEDLKIFWESLISMWDIDRSASRGMMACRGLYIFTHNNNTGQAQAHELFERIRAARKNDGDVPRSFEDYEILVDETGLPEGITLTKLGIPQYAGV